MFNKLAKLARNTGPARFFVPVGIILIVFGALMLATQPKEYAQTTGTVTSVERYEDADGSASYDVKFTFTVDGTEYEGVFSGEFGHLKSGDTVDVYYDPNNPENVSNTDSGGIIAPILIVVGGVAIVYGVYATVKAFQKQKALDDQIKAATGSDELPEIVPLPKSELNELYISWDGNSLKPGYFVENEDRDILYEAKMTKQALVGPRTFTFINHATGETTEHAVGHTVSQTYNNGWFTMKSWFSFDDKNVWDYLHERGVRIETDLASILPKVGYTVSVNGAFVASIETSSKYVHEEDEAKHKIAVPCKYFYRMWTNSTDLDLMFLTVFAISETEQAVVE